MSKEDRPIKLRKATINDSNTLKYWDQQEHVIDSNPNDKWNWDVELKRDVEWRELLIGEKNSEPIGFLQIIIPKLEETNYWGNEIDENIRAIDVWIGHKKDLSKGYGSEMMKLGIARCFKEKSVKAILIDPLSSNESAHKFYERLGFKYLEKRIMNEDECYIFELKRDDWYLNLDK